MEDQEIAERLTLLEVIWTPARRYRNRIVAVGQASVTVVSERTENQREISFHKIRQGTTRNGCIVYSIRVIFGLERLIPNWSGSEEE